MKLIRTKGELLNQLWISKNLRFKNKIFYLTNIGPVKIFNVNFLYSCWVTITSKKKTTI